MLNKALIGLLVAFFIYNKIIYSDFAPASFQAQDLPDYTKYLSERDSLQNVRIFRHPQLQFPEDLTVDQQGNIYVGLVDGRIIRIDSNDVWTEVGKSTGWVLKIVHSGNKLTFIDVKVGICEFNLRTKQINIIVPKPSWIKFLNSFVIAKDGKIYFTDTSHKYDENNYYMDFFEGKPHGAVYVWNPQTKYVSLVLDNLYYANGIEISKDQTTLFIAETYRYRIIRFYLSGTKTGTYDYLIENIAGFPDNIHFNDRQELWVGVPVFRDSLMNFGDRNAPIAKKMLSFLPRPLWKYLSGAPYAGGFKLNSKTGQIIHVLRGDKSKLFCITTIFQKNGNLYLGSIMNNAIGILPSSQ